MFEIPQSQYEIQPSTLYVTATPIGNLTDITIRALHVLSGVDIIACEDTRHSLKLLNHYKIKKRLISYHSYNEKNSVKGIIKLLQEGKSVALISDSGTPCISDPGFLIINECRKNDINIIAIPGPSAFLTLLTGSGFRTDNFYFHGFLSIKGGRKKNQLLKMKEIQATHIIYESPHRLIKTLTIINEIFEKKSVCLGKELTKMNEKIIIGTSIEIIEKISGKKTLGEYVILVANY